MSPSEAGQGKPEEARPGAIGPERGPTLVLGALAGELEATIGLLESRRAISWHSWHGRRFLEGELRREDELEGGSEPIVVAEIGVGKTLSALVSQHLVDRYRPRRMILVGAAGALAPDLSVGDVPVAEDCLRWDIDARAVGLERGRIPHTDYRVFLCDTALVDAASAFPPEAGTLRRGRLVTGDTVITGRDADAYRFLRDELGGDAVDMEGASVGLVAAVNGIPFVCVRTISDRVFDDRPVDFRSATAQAARNARGLTEHLLFARS